jgi:regulator of RNase E activity RraA
MVGMAFTVKQLQRHQESEGYSLTRHAEVIDQLSSSGDVLVIDVGGRLDICTGGAILALRAQLRGLSGFLIDGCFRDVQELINNEFPVHCRGISPVKSSPDLETVGINIPVLIGGVQIKPGDLIVADETGIIVIASKSAEKVLKVAWEIKTKEEKVTKYLRAGMSHKEAIAQSEIDLKSVDQGEK